MSPRLEFKGAGKSIAIRFTVREEFARPTLCLEKFWASEAALSLATLTDNLTGWFQRHPGWQQKVTIPSLRSWLLLTAGGLSHPSPCNAVENRPIFTSEII